MTFRRIKRCTAFSAVEQSRDCGRKSSLIWLKKLVKMRGKSAEPHYALIDSQSVKTVADNEARGIDGGKKQKGANGMPS